MDVKIINEIPLDEIIARVRKVPLKGLDEHQQPIRPYANCPVGARVFSPEELNPTTFYILRANLDFQRSLRGQLMDSGYDSLNLTAALELRNTDTNDQWTLMPPMVEIVEEEVRYVNSRGDKEYDSTHRIRIPIINDGLHRITLARELGEPVTTITAGPISFNHPFYAYPNSWDEVKLVDKLETQASKKLYRRTDNYALYRDFETLGCGAPRKVE